MNIVKFSESMSFELSNFQKDLLQNLQDYPDGWLHLVRLDRLEMYQVLNIYTQWQESQLVNV